MKEENNMFIERLIEKFGYDTPIFTDEILVEFPEYTRAYVFRLIKAAESNKKICKVDTGVYYLPQKTPFGLSIVTGAEVVRKKYITDGTEQYGIYGGLSLQNAFSLTTQNPNILEIITNKESSRCRQVMIDGMTFILRRSRTKITSDNVDAYRVLQLFSEDNGIEINDEGIKKICEFITKKGIKRNTLIDTAKYFPAKTLSRLIFSGVL